MIINLFTILPLTCAIFVLLLGFYVFVKGRKSRMHQLLAAFCVAMFFWLFGTFMLFALRLQNAEAAVFWDRFVYFGVSLMPALMQHFSLVFTGNKGQRKTLVLNYIVGVFFMMISQTPYFVDDLYIYDWGAHTQARLFHHIFLVYFFLAISLFFINLIKFYRQTQDKQKRKQAISVMIAIGLVMFVGGTAYLYAYNIDTRFPFGYFSGLTFPIILFYTLIRHGLIRAKVIATEIIVGLTNFVLVTQLFLSKTLLDLVLRLFFAIVVTIIGILLVRSVQQEVKRREQIGKLAHSLEQANLRLKELDRQKTEFLSIASHQLRTPLSIIKGYIELIQDGAYGKATQKMVNVLGDMDESNERLVKLVDEFLDISRIEQGRTKYSYEDSDINELISSVVKELTERAQNKGLTLNWQPNGPTLAYMDAEKIRHVVFNFVDNSIKYTNKGSINVSLEADSKNVTVHVVDTGIGFGKKDQANFFQKFYRGENVKSAKVNGTGLGIFVCKKFIETHGGKVWAKSPGLGKGSEFGFFIPVKKGRQKTPKSMPKKQALPKPAA